MSVFRRSDDWRSSSLRADPMTTKRQKTTEGYVSTSSQTALHSDDIVDEISSSPPASPYVTQPTQLLEPNPPTLAMTNPSPVVQVPASSPFQPKTSNKFSNQAAPPVGRLSNLMAPAGTEFRRPLGVVRAQSPQKKQKRDIIDISDDDGPQYTPILSSDDEADELTKSDIKPSSFVARNKGANQFGQTNGGGKTSSRSQLDLTAFVYDANKSKQSQATSSRPFNGTSAAAHNPKESIDLTKSRQTRPDRPQPVVDITAESIVDDKLRTQVVRLSKIYPDASIALCKDTLVSHKGNFDDAADVLANRFVTLSSDGEDTKKNAGDRVPQMKTQLKQPVGSIQARWASTQKLAARPAPPSPEKQAPKPRKRLVQGRRAASSPSPERASPILIKSSSPAPVPVQRKRPVLDVTDDSDSGIASATDDDEVDLGLEEGLLKWLNTCTANQLADLANIKKPEAEGLLATRPFRSLDQARQYTTAAPSKRKTTRLTAGEKIINAASDMWRAYDAVDELVKQCNDLAKPLKAEIATWGFNLFGASTDGELELVSFEDGNNSPRDSGIGTPRSVKQSSDETADEDVRVAQGRAGRRNFLAKPAMMNDEVVLKDYQIVGLNWLDLLYRHKLSCILADDMGLGKTCQVITFLSHLAATGNTGPHLIIVPGSTLENWLREFQFFSPGLVVEPYYGPQNERLEMADALLDRRDEINVVVTTYDMAAKPIDNKFLRRLRPDVCVYDEGHLLKNPNSQRYQGLVKIPANFRLLLTGTPLQNNLKELTALLSFILPSVFIDLKDDLDFIFKHKATTSDTDHDALLSDQRISRARSMLTPFVLRRKKEQVLKYLPSKTCRVEYCDLDPSQAEIYGGYVEQAVKRAKLRLEGVKIPKSDETQNPLMQLRKAAIHAQLFRRHFTDSKIEEMADILRKRESEHFSPKDPRKYLIQEMQGMSDFWLHGWCDIYPNSIGRFDIEDGSWMNSGKVQTLVRLLKKYKANGERVLIFSQFALVLDILEAVLNTIRVQFTRIDGSTRIDERQTLIDQFRDEEDITAFLLTTKAGGTGLNLTYANKVIIFDSSFNPQDDAQAENRAHRLGQTREVEVVRLVTKGTIEEQIYALGQSKLALDSKVAGAGAGGEDNGEAAEARGEELVEKFLIEAGSATKA